MAGFNQGSLDILRAEMLWRYLLPSTLHKFLKINHSASFPFGHFSNGKVLSTCRYCALAFIEAERRGVSGK